MATASATVDRTSTSSPTQESIPNLPLEAILTGCTAWNTVNGGPAELFGGPLPPGWQPESSPVFQLLQLYECTRLSWGTFERGPVHLIFELSEDFIAPEACERGDFERESIVRALWIDDAEIGAWLAKTYNFPIRIATVNVERVGAEATVETWKWAQTQDAQSELHFQFSIPRSDPTTTRHRLYWFDQDSVNYMDLSKTFSYDDNAMRASAGVLQQPTIYANWTGSNEYAGLADRLYGLDAAVSISLFDDFQCGMK
jgi:hypothetical protein